MTSPAGLCLHLPATFRPGLVHIWLWDMCLDMGHVLEKSGAPERQSLQESRIGGDLYVYMWNALGEETIFPTQKDSSMESSMDQGL